MPKKCPSCGSELFYRDNDNPILNCVAQCENVACKSPYREEYYEEPADADLFRTTELWEECYLEIWKPNAYVHVTTRDDETIKRADSLYLKRVEETLK